jgi:5-methylcytosine-specific restriction endonuclease McrA
MSDAMARSYGEPDCEEEQSELQRLMRAVMNITEDDDKRPPDWKPPSRQRWPKMVFTAFGLRLFNSVFLSPRLYRRSDQEWPFDRVRVLARQRVNGGELELVNCDFPAGGFYDSREWRELRYRALKRHGGSCQCCGTRANADHPLHVDHIKPRSLYPEMELDINNLQVLCEDCNLGKSNKDVTDWRAA